MGSEALLRTRSLWETGQHSVARQLIRIEPADPLAGIKIAAN